MLAGSAQDNFYQGRIRMTRRWTALLAGGALFAFAGAAMAHHSFAMFDYEHPIQIEGTVRYYKFINPHSFISLVVTEDDGSATTWNLEGQSTNGLVREGWSSRSLKPGDELKMQVNPLRSGAPGGDWAIEYTWFKDGQPVVKPVAKPPAAAPAAAPKDTY
jgi:hypothetical protein